MTTIDSFYKRLKRIGIEVEMWGNYPWVYLVTVNGKKVHGTFESEHRFTVFFTGVKYGDRERITDIGIIFDKIRETLKQDI